MNQQPICLFDSGIGGLTVLKKLLQKYPNENYIYLADLANVPFGDKSKSEIKDIATGIIDWFKQFNPKIIIMACNTSSSVLCEQDRINPAPTVPTFGIIEPCAKEIAKSNYKKISVWATRLVIENNAYKNAINRSNPKIIVEEISCPKLVPMIESLNFNENDKIKIIQEYLNLTSNNSQALILGCTHYPLLNEDLKKLTKIKIIDPADALVNELEFEIALKCHPEPKAKDLITLGDSSVVSLLQNDKLTISLYTTAQKEKLERFLKFYLDTECKVRLVNLSKSSSFSK